MPTASAPLNSAWSRCSSVPSSTVATCPSRMTCPSRSATTSLAKSSGVSSRPLSRMARSSSAPLSRPTGAARFCASSACTTSATLTPAACRSAGRSSTVSSRSRPPTTLTCATPGTVRSSRTIIGSAMRVSVAVGISAERERQREHRLLRGIEPGEHRLLHLGRQVGPLGGDGVADVLRCLLDVLLEVEEDGELRQAVGRAGLGLGPVDPADGGERLLDRVDDLPLHRLGRGAGIEDGDADDRLLDVGKLVGVQVDAARRCRTPPAPPSR